MQRPSYMSIFTEQISRKPDLYPWATEFIESMHAGFWTDKEFNFQSDIQDFKVALTAQEREIVVRALSAIGQIEVAVKKFWAKLGDNLPHPSLSDLGYVMANTEVVHGNAYERLLVVLGLEDVFEENLQLPIIGRRVRYLRKYTHRYYKDSRQQYVYALILFTIFIENVSLFSQFYIVNWFNRYRNVLRDTAQQTQYTRNEETIHALVGIKLLNVIRKESPELFGDDLIARVNEEAQEAFESESAIIDWMVNGYNEKGLNAAILKELVKSRINFSLKQIGLRKIFAVDKDLLRETEWFDEEVYGNNMADFFHAKPVEYQKKSKSFDAGDLF